MNEEYTTVFLSERGETFGFISQVFGFLGVILVIGFLIFMVKSLFERDF